VREVIAIIYNVNAKKGRRKKGKDLIPLGIDGKLPMAMTKKEAVNKFWRALKKDKALKNGNGS